jgi:hypothetical protein
MKMTSIRRAILRANAIFLVVAAVASLCMDVLGIFFGLGPESRLVASAPYTGVGFVEAHGLALIIGVLLWGAQPLRFWHLTAAAVHILLGTANLVFWEIFIAADMLVVGYLTTSLHWLFVALQLFAATVATADGTAMSTRSSSPSLPTP